MKQINNKQQGITFIGIVFVLGCLGFFILLGLRLFPLYNEKFTVLTNMENIASRPDALTLSTRAIRKAFLKNMEIANSTRFDDKTIKELVTVKKDKKTKKKYLHVQYDGKNDFIKEIKLLLVFDHKVELGGATSE